MCEKPPSPLSLSHHNQLATIVIYNVLTHNILLHPRSSRNIQVQSPNL